MKRSEVLLQQHPLRKGTIGRGNHEGMEGLFLVRWGGSVICFCKSYDPKATTPHVPSFMWGRFGFDFELFFHT